MALHATSPEHETIQLQRLLAGDEKAFAFFYDRYSLPVYRKLLRLIKVEFVAEEILQTVFIRIWEKRAMIDPEQGLKAYIFQIARNMVYDFYRDLARENELQQQVRYISTEITEDSASRLLYKETNELLELAIEQLPDQQKIVFRLCKLEGKSYNEVSKLLGISTSTINGHIVRATKKIKTIMFESQHVTCAVTLPAMLLLLSKV